MDPLLLEADCVWITMCGYLPRGTYRSCCPPNGRSSRFPIVVLKMPCSLVKAQLSRPFADFERPLGRVVDGDGVHVSLAVSAILEARRQCQRLSVRGAFSLAAPVPPSASGLAETLENAIAASLLLLLLLLSALLRLLLLNLLVVALFEARY